MFSRMFLISILMSSAACTPAEDYDEEIGVEANESIADRGGAAPLAEALTDARSGGARAVATSNETIEFEYSYPAEAGRIGALASLLDAEIDKAQSGLQADAMQDKANAEANGYPFRPHSFSAEWAVVADLPGWLSLSAEISTYMGGAHPNHGFDALLWNKTAGEAVEPLAVFRSAAALENALGGAFCAMLNAEREQRRGQPVDTASDDLFEACPALSDLTILLGSSNGETFDRIGLLVAPYIAGPYAEGSYEFTLPVNSAVLDAVKPEYASSFSIQQSQ